MKTEKREIVGMHTFQKEGIICDFILKEGFYAGVKFSENYHFHSFFEIHYVLHGKMHIVINDHDIYLNSGDVCVIPPKLVHYIYRDEESHRIGFRFLYRQLKNREDDGYFARFQSAYGSLQEACILPGNHLFQQCVNVSREAFTEAAPAYIVDELIFLALDLLSYSIQRKDYETVPNTNTFTDSLIADYIEDYLNLRYQGTPKLAELANALKLSVRQTQRVILRLFGTSFSGLVAAKRLTVARFLLKNTSLSVEQIAYQVGFCDKPYFYRKFSAYYGTTPLRYRKSVNALDSSQEKPKTLSNKL